MYSRECYIRCTYFHLYSCVCDIICSWLKLNPNLFEGCCLRGVTGTLTPDSSFLPPPCSTWARRRRPTTCSFRPQEAFLRFFFQIETHTHTRQSWKNIFLFLCRICFCYILIHSIILTLNSKCQKSARQFFLSLS